jgi:hypothetical protein
MVLVANNRPHRALHYNVHFKNGNRENWVTEPAICGLRPADIEWVWVSEDRRRATTEEILNLCKLVCEI